MYSDLLHDYHILQEENTSLKEANQRFVEQEMQRFIDELEKMRQGFMTILTKLATQEGTLSQVQLELESYRRGTQYDSDTTTRHDIGTSNHAQTSLQASAQRATSQRKFASDIKRREVRAYYAQYYPQQSQQHIADHFGISVRTLQRYLEHEMQPAHDVTRAV